VCRRPVSVVTPLARGGDGAVEHVAIGVVREHPPRLAHRDPAHIVVLVIVTRDITAESPHEKEMHDLVHALARDREPVLDRPDRPHDLDVEPALLAYLAERGLLDRLAWIGRALREHPGAVAVTPGDHDLELIARTAHDDAACGRGGTNTSWTAGARRRHGGKALPNCFDYKRMKRYGAYGLVPGTALARRPGVTRERAGRERRARLERALVAAKSRL